MRTRLDGRLRFAVRHLPPAFIVNARLHFDAGSLVAALEA